jgi:hypothetical protein
MRTKLSIVFALAVLAFASLAFVSSPVAAQATPKATPVVKPLKCDDPAFLKQLSSDLTSFGTMLSKFDASDTVGVTKTLVATIALRQQYEDLDSVPDNCVSAQYTVIDTLSNFGDAIALVEASKTDPDNAKDYLAAVPDQIARANTYFKSLTDLVGANK